MELLILTVLALALGLGFYASARSANLLARIEVNEGHAELVRGRLPPRLWFEIEDVVQRNPAQTGEIRLDVDRGQARVRASGLGEEVVQQIRNAVGQHQLAQLRRGSRLARRSRAG